LIISRTAIGVFKTAALALAGDNLLNQKYQINYGYPMPGIYFNTGFNVKF